MRARRGCRPVIMAVLFIVVACLVFVALAGVLVWDGQVPIYPPRLIAFEPQPGDAVLPTTPISLTFDQPMDPESVQAVFSLEPAVPGAFQWSRNRRQAAFLPATEGYEFDTRYTVRLAAGAQAARLPRATGRSTEWSFYLPPILDSFSPPLGSDGLGPYPDVRAHFNFALDCAPTMRSFSLEPQSLGLLGCKDHTLTFSPTVPLAADTDYVASLAHVFLEGDATPRPGLRWEFRTAPPLTVLDVTPSSNLVLDLHTPLRITFNRPVVADSVGPGRAQLLLFTEDGQDVPGQITWQDDGAVLVFQPVQPLFPGTGYRLRLQPGVLDRLGFLLDEPLISEFGTVQMLGLPLPVPGTTDVPLDSEIRVPFTRPMDRLSVEAGLTITPAVEGSTSWEEDTLVFTPRTGLAPETLYDLALSPEIRDATGAPLARPSRWAFATEPFLSKVQVPSGQAVDDLGQVLQITFALPMRPNSVATALTISPPTPGESTWSDDGQTLTFRPESGWQPGADYQVSLGATARTASGQALGESLTWAFATAQSEVRFGQGPNLQIVGAAGDRAFQFAYRGANAAKFALYPITPTQFLDLYSAGSQGVDPQEPGLIDTSTLTLTLTWREVLSPLQAGLEWEDWQPAQAHLPGDLPSGIYLLTARPPAGEQGQLLVVLTEHALAVKRSLVRGGDADRAELVAWDVQIDGGGPVVSSTVRIYDRDGILVAEGLTDDQGLLSIDVPGDPRDFLILSDRSGDLTVCGLGPEWGGLGWVARSGWAEPLARSLYNLYTYTDRPIYRPGQTVHFKEFLRRDDDALYSLPSSTLSVTVRLRDARDNVVASRVLTPTAFGTLFGDFQLAQEPVLGTWQLETEVPGAVARHSLQVEEYRKPEYEVSVHTPRQTYVQGEALSVTVDAAYYFGQPVAGADVTLDLFVSYPSLYGGQDGLNFGPAVAVGQGETDAQGRWSAELNTEGFFSGENDGQDMVLLALEATVTDEAGQAVSSYETVTLRRANRGLSLLLPRRGYRPEEEITFAAEVRDRAKEPLAGVEVLAQILGWDDAQVAVATATTAGDGQAHFSFSLAGQGWYQVQLSTVDDGGREVAAEGWLWVYDPGGQAAWYGGRWGRGQGLEISADRQAYAVGDVAQVVVQSPISGPALLTLERGATRQARALDLISGTNLITLPIRPDFVPNIFFTINQFGPPDPDRWEWETQPEAMLYRASTRILVPAVGQRLTVTVDAGQETYAPGDEAGFLVRVTDHQGRPVQAEVSLAVVDEAIYALADDLTLDPFEAFYAPRPNLVGTFDSLRPTRWLAPDGRGGLGGDGEPTGTPRRDFQDTAYCAPQLVTDEAGEAQIRFDLPDNLTQWRVLARAITTDTLVGQATASITTAQEIVVRPALPRFLTQGDAVTLTAVVHNFTGQPLSATVDVTVEGLALVTSPGAEGPSQAVHLPAGRSAAVHWPAAVQEAGQARILFQATATQRGTRLFGRDAVESRLPIYPAASHEVTTYAGELTPGLSQEALTLTLPADALPDLTRLEINLAPSLAPGLLHGLEYLVGYPYGCVEQTMSRVLPNTMVARTFGSLGLRSEFLEDDLSPMIALGLQRLYGFQHPDGGWGWWYDDRTDLHMTTYVILGLGMTGQAGFLVDEGVIERGVTALTGMLVDAEPHARAYGAYALAMAGQPISPSLTLTEALALDPFSQAALVTALDAAGDGDAQVVGLLLDELREAAIQEDGFVYWPDAGDADYRRQTIDSPVRTTAMVIYTLVRLDPQSPLLPGAVRWLIDQRRGNGWGDTQQTSFAILALSDYLLAAGELAAGSPFQVYVNDRLWTEGQLDRAAMGQTLVLTYQQEISPALLVPGENRLQLVLGAAGQAPAGRLYYAATLRVLRPPPVEGFAALQTHERAIAVARDYLPYDGDEPATTFRRGDLVQVRLTLDVPEESWYVVVDDPLPAGFEALNERLGTTSHVAAPAQDQGFYWELYGYNRREVRDDRVLFFITRLAPGPQTFTYLARAATAGEFTAPPVQVYPMYEPQVWSRSEGARCRVVD
ncbi:MAG: Ig-like domain-containing protein [Anaerolineae bacterium]